MAHQKRLAIRLAVSLCELLAATQDAEVDALLESYAQTDEDDDADQLWQSRAVAASYLGANFAQGREFRSPEESIRAALEFQQKKMQAPAGKHDARQAQRKDQRTRAHARWPPSKTMPDSARLNC
jgi:hypothetical protein